MRQKIGTVALLSIIPLVTILQEQSSFELADYSFLFFKFLLLVLLTGLSTRPTAKSGGSLVWVAVIASYTSFLLIRPTDEALSYWELSTLIFALTFYSVIMLWSYIILGRNFSVLPEKRSIVVTGPYQLVAHPIYTCCFLLMLAYVSVYLSWANVLALIVFLVSLIYRGVAESRLLSIDNEHYQCYRRELPFKGYAVFSIPALASVLAGIFAVSRPEIPLLKVSTNIPFYSLSPIKYDDWTSVFIGNHIWARLVSDNKRPEVPGVLKSYRVDCVGPRECNRKKIIGEIADLEDCAGRVISKTQIEHELQMILGQKRWILPNYTFCESESSSICIEFDRIENIEGRMQAVYLRFGWSKFDLINIKEPTGASNYCLANLSLDKDNMVRESILLAKDQKAIPRAIMLDSNARSYDVALFKDAVKKDYSILNASTPLAYYVLSYPSEFARPWNTEWSMKTISTHLTKNDYIFNSGWRSDVVPEGDALKTRTRKASIKRETFVLPSYIVGCDELKIKLESEWKKTDVKCQDLSLLTQDIVISNKKWDGFMSPLSPGAPYKEAIYDQYFSGTSSDSWLQESIRNRNFFYLIGLGRTEITVRSNLICSLRENYLGLSDLHVFDMNYCR